MSNHPFVLAAVFGLSYLLIWTIYRLFRWWEHRGYRIEHHYEHARRAIGGNFLNTEERQRRAAWEARYGPLMSGLELKSREETRWPIGAALQGAATVSMSLIIAAMIWSVRGHPVDPPPSPTPPAPPAPPAPVQDAPEAFVLPFFVFLMAVFVGAGFVLLVKAQSNLGKAAGVALALSAPLLTGMKLLSVDKLLSAHSLFSLHYHGRPAQEVAHELAPFSTSVSFPAFPSGTAQPQPALQCAMDTLAAEIARDRDLHLVLVVGRADRQELSLTARGRYATNWGLAQQRGDFFAGVLRSRGLPAAKLIVTTAGPLHTKNAQPNSEWDDDRRVSIFVQGQGSVHSWTEKIGRGGVWSLCDKRLGGGA